MSVLPYLLLTAIFLPLFPLSAGVNWILAHSRHFILRAALLLLWPHIGLIIIQTLEPTIPEWIVPLALATSGLYALRALALRDVGQWSGYLATSAWALLWIPLQGGTPALVLHMYALGFSIPLALLALLGGGLERRFGAARTGLYGGLASSMPRFATVLVFVVLAIIATPLFPAFFIMLAIILQAIARVPSVAIGLAGVWLLWSWAGARLLQGLIVGPTGEQPFPDLNRAATWVFSLSLLLLVVAGIYGMGELS
jgi:NADH:ubiquinone oxidoreductase subunit 4 (subunit M)